MKKFLLATAITIAFTVVASAQAVVRVCSLQDGFANLRSAPSLNARILLPINSGYPVTVMSWGGRWNYVKYEDDSRTLYGYVSADMFHCGR